MKARVVYSSFVWFLTIIITTVAVAVCALSFNEPVVFWCVLIIPVGLLVPSALYAPLSLTVDERNITVNSLLKRHRIPLRNVKEVELFQPTMGALRICASGGYMGYWGIFKEGDVGRYVGYYGKASDCFLVRMKNGDKYVLGCKDPAAAVDYINAVISKG
ncbi:MAG: PH domain-containing protein [Muribaculaceae bacterium]|nr:PH domain-containing protein [Muribaculaceae bacterium]